MLHNVDPEPLPPPPWETVPPKKYSFATSSPFQREIKFASQDIILGALIFISLFVLFVGGVISGCEATLK